MLAIYWLDLGAAGLFVSIAAGFCGYTAVTSAAILSVKRPQLFNEPIVANQDRESLDEAIRFRVKI